MCTLETDLESTGGLESAHFTVIVILQSFHCKAPQSHTGDKLPLVRPVGPTAGPARVEGCAAVVCGGRIRPPY